MSILSEFSLFVPRSTLSRDTCTSDERNRSIVLYFYPPKSCFKILASIQNPKFQNCKLLHKNRKICAENENLYCRNRIRILKQDLGESAQIQFQSSDFMFTIRIQFLKSEFPFSADISQSYAESTKQMEQTLRAKVKVKIFFQE